MAAFLLERQRKSDEEAARARARQKAKEDEGLAELAEAMLAAPPCAVCGTRQPVSSWWRPEGSPPSGSGGPARYGTPSCTASPDSGICRLTGSRPDRPGVPASAGFAQVRTAGFYDDAGFCQDCDAPYCYQHWHVSETGYGYCPRGHGKSLDAHWSPW